MAARPHFRHPGNSTFLTPRGARRQRARQLSQLQFPVHLKASAYLINDLTQIVYTPAGGCQGETVRRGKAARSDGQLRCLTPPNRHPAHSSTRTQRSQTRMSPILTTPSAELPNEPRLLPNHGQGDLRLTREGGWRMVLRKDKDKVEIGNSGSTLQRRIQC